MNIEKDFLINLGRKIQQLRKGSGLSQEQLASLCNLDRTYISGVERGKRNIGIKNLKLIADNLQTPLSELFRNMEQNYEGS